MAKPIRAKVLLSLEKETSLELLVFIACQPYSLPTSQVSQPSLGLGLSKCVIMELGVVGSHVVGQRLSSHYAVSTI